MCFRFPSSALLQVVYTDSGASWWRRRAPRRCRDLPLSPPSCKWLRERSRPPSRACPSAVRTSGTFGAARAVAQPRLRSCGLHAGSQWCRHACGAVQQRSPPCPGCPPTPPHLTHLPARRPQGTQAPASRPPPRSGFGLRWPLRAPRSTCTSPGATPAAAATRGRSKAAERHAIQYRQRPPSCRLRLRAGTHACRWLVSPQPPGCSWVQLLSWGQPASLRPGLPRA